MPVPGGLPGVEVMLERSQISDRGIQPDVEKFTRGIGDRDAKVGCIA